MAVESVCQPPLIIILSSGSPCSSRSRAAPTLNEWPLSDFTFVSSFNSACSAFKIVLILAGLRLLLVCPCLFIDLRI